jgi:hypothetical protein
MNRARHLTGQQLEQSYQEAPPLLPGSAGKGPDRHLPQASSRHFDSLISGRTRSSPNSTAMSDQFRHYLFFASIPTNVRSTQQGRDSRCLHKSILASTLLFEPSATSVVIDTNRQGRQSSILIDITVSIVYLLYTNHFLLCIDY